MLSGKRTTLESQDKNVTIFFSDLSGFTQLAERLEADDLALFLNIYLTEMNEIAMRFGGTIDKIIGDSIMVFFGDPESRGIKNDALSCVSMALAMRKSMTKLKNRWQAVGIENPPSIRMRINSGLCKVGHFGTEHHLTYTLLGRSVNLASRLESAADNDEILISFSTYSLVKDIVNCMNIYLTEMNEIAMRFGGTIDKIIGDSIMVFFGDPESRGIKNDALSCVSMALAMRKSMTKLKNRWQAVGIENPPSIRMRINSGLCKVGHFGTEHHLTYTLLGRSVNLASRLESAADNDEILISFSTYSLVKDIVNCIPKGQLAIKGFSQPIIAYSAVDLSTRHGNQTPKPDYS